MIVLKGSVAVFVQEEDGRPMRLAGVRPGGLLGEVGFLDGSPRSADVVAQEDTTVAVLTRQAWRQLAERDDPIASKLLVSIAVSLAGRLRHMNEMALARSRLWIQASTDAGEAIRAATV